MIRPSGARAQTEFYVERCFRRSTLVPSPVASRLPLPGQGEDEGEGRKKVHGKNSACGEEKFALIRAIPRTGRTHHIRVHLSQTGHPILACKFFGPNNLLTFLFLYTDCTPDLYLR